MVTTMKKILIVGFCRASITVLLLASFALSAKAAPPCATDTVCPFKKATMGGPNRDGTFYCAADPGHSCGYIDQSVTVELDPGMTIDTSYYQGDGYWCCWVEGQIFGSKLKECVPRGCISPLMLPANAPDLLGLYVEVTGAKSGTRGIYFRTLKPDINSIDKDGTPRKWIIRAYVFCEPDPLRLFHSSRGCETTANAWIKQTPKVKSN
jgi:hypothetical protein